MHLRDQSDAVIANLIHERDDYRAKWANSVRDTAAGPTRDGLASALVSVMAEPAPVLTSDRDGLASMSTPARDESALTFVAIEPAPMLTPARDESAASELNSAPVMTPRTAKHKISMLQQEADFKLKLERQSLAMRLQFKKLQHKAEREKAELIAKAEKEKEKAKLIAKAEKEKVQLMDELTTVKQEAAYLKGRVDATENSFAADASINSAHSERNWRHHLQLSKWIGVQTPS